MLAFDAKKFVLAALRSIVFCFLTTALYIGKVARFIGLLLLTLFAITAPAQAEVESVPPSLTWCGVFPSFGISYSCGHSTDLAAAQAIAADYNNSQPRYRFVVLSCDGNGLCSYCSTLLVRSGGVPAGTQYCYGVAAGLVELHKNCPAPTVNPAILYYYNPVTRMCERPAQTTCPVPALTAPPFNDACAEVLENIHSTQTQKDAACGALTPAMQAGKACLEGKLSSISPAIQMKITGDIRNIAYQAHLREIWDKMLALVALEDDPVKRTACAVRRAEIAAEKGCDNAGPCESCYSPSATQRSHCIKGRPAKPSPNDAQHTQGNAIDVSLDYTISPLQDVLDARNPPQTIPQFLDAPTDCNLIWGGTFKTNKDSVHFLAR